MALLTPTIVNATATDAADGFDGNSGTSAKFYNLNDYILLDFGAPRVITHITTSTVAFGAGATVTAYASDAAGTPGVQVAEISDTAGTFSSTSSTATRYLKLVYTNVTGVGDHYQLGEIQISAARTGHVSIGLATGAVHEAVFMDDATVTSGDNYSADTKTYGWFRDVQITILNPPATGFVTSVAGSYWEKGGETIGHAVKQNQVLGLNTGLLMVDDATGDRYRLKVASGVLSVEAV